MKKLNNNVHLIKATENIDYSAIAAKLCGKELTEDQQEEVNKLHDLYIKVAELKNNCDTNS